MNRSFDEALAAALAEARRAWPSVEGDAAGFAAYVRERLPAHEDPALALGAVHVTDLYLAYGCAQGMPAALAVFERELMAPAARSIARVDRSPRFVSEVRRLLCERLFAGTWPRIQDYTGRGPLAGWLRVAATRVALEARRDAAPEPPPPGPGIEPDPALAAIRRQDGDEALRALRQALAGLPPLERELLRMHYVEGVSVQKLGDLHGLDRLTASRRVASARQRVLAETRRQLEKLEPGLTARGRDRLVSALGSRLQVSLTVVLDRPR